MARLPQPGGDQGTWGDVLNDFLATAHNTDGTLKDDAISSTSIQDGSVTTPKLADNAVTTPKIADSTVTTPKISDNAVTEPKLLVVNPPAAGQILSYDGANLAWTNTGSPDPAMGGDLTGPASDAQIVNGAVDSAEIAGNAVGTIHLQDSSVTAPKLDTTNNPSTDQRLAYDGSSLTWVNATDADPPLGGDLTGTASSAQIVAGAVDSAEIATSAVGTTHLQASAVTTPIIADNAVTDAKLDVTNTPVGGQVLSFNGTNFTWVTTNATDPIVGGDLTGTASSAQIVAGAVGSTELATNAVATVNLQNVSVTNAKLADDSVDAAKLANNAVDTTAILDGAVSEVKLDSAVQTKLNGVSNSITVAKAGTDIGTRPKMNFIEGSNVTISTVDDVVNNRVDVSISSAGSGGAADATTTSKGIVQLAGDLAGTAVAPVVASGAITNAKLAATSVATGNLQNLAVTTAKIADANITTAKIADNAVATVKLNTTNTPTSGQVLSYNGTNMLWSNASGDPSMGGDISGTASAAQIVAGAVGATELATNAVTTAKVNDGAITTTKLGTTGAPSSGQVLTYNGTSLAWTAASTNPAMGGDLSGNANNAQIIAGAVGTAELGTNAVTTAKITDSNITTAKLANDAVTEPKLAMSNLPANGQVIGWNGTALTWTTIVPDDPSTGGDLSGPVSNAQIVVGAVGASELATNAVITSKINDGAVTTAKLGTTGAPTSGQLLSYNGTTMAWANAPASDPSMGGDLSGVASAAQIVAGAVGPTELATNAVTTVKITDANVTTAKIADSNVTTAKINDGAVTTAKLGTTGAPTSGQVLTYNGTALAWSNAGSADPTMGGDLSGPASNAQIVANAVNTTALINDAVTEPKLAVSNSPSSGQILSWNGTALAWANAGSPDPAMGGDISGVASNAQIVAGAVGATELATNAVTTAKIATTGSPSSGQVLTYNGSALAWTNAGSADPSMGGDLSGVASAATIVANAVTASKLATNAVTTVKVNDGAITTTKLGTTGAPTTGQVLSYNGTTMAWTAAGGDPAVGGDLSGVASNAQIVNNAVGTAQIADNTVTEPKLAVSNTAASGQVLSWNGTALAWANAGSPDPSMGGDLSGTASAAQIVAGAVGATELATNAVTSVKITDLNVTSAKLANDAVTEPKLAMSNSPSNGQVIGWNGTSLTWVAQSAGSVDRFTAVAKSAGYTANDYEFVICNATSGGFTVTLPAAVNGGWVRVKKTDASANAITVVPTSGQIDNLASDAVNTQWQSQDYASDGTKWYRV